MAYTERHITGWRFGVYPGVRRIDTSIRIQKKSSVLELIALDPCAEAFDEDPAKVKLSKQAEFYYVFARAGGNPSNILLVRDPFLEDCAVFGHSVVVPGFPRANRKGTLTKVLPD